MSNYQGHHKKKSLFVKMCSSKTDAIHLIKMLNMSVGLKRWLTGIQWKINMCQNKSSAMPDCKNTSLVFM